MATKTAVKKTTSKEVAKIKEGALTSFDFTQDAGAGMEGTTKDDFAIPFLRVLQSNSPQCEESEPEFIEGAQKGMLFNTATQQLVDGKVGLVFLPCAFQRTFLQWGARGTESAGFKGAYQPERIAEMQRDGTVVGVDNRLFMANKDGDVYRSKDGSIISDKVSDTRSHFVLLLDEDGNYEQAIISLDSTQIKKSKLLMAALARVKINGQTPPTWMNRVRMMTTPEKNDKGSWYGVRFELEGFIDDKAHYDAGKAFHKAIGAGEVKVNYEAAQSTESSAVSEDDPAF